MPATGPTEPAVDPDPDLRWGPGAGWLSRRSVERVLALRHGSREAEHSVRARSHGRGVGTDLFVEFLGGTLETRLELGCQSGPTQLVLPHRLRALAQPHVAPHRESMGILTTWVDGEQGQGIVQGSTVRTDSEPMLGDPCARLDVPSPETLSLDDVPYVAREHEVALIDRRCRSEVRELAFQVTGATQSFTSIDGLIELDHVDGHARPQVEAVSPTVMDDHMSAGDRLAQRPLERVHQRVERLDGQARRHFRPQSIEQLVPREARRLEGEVADEAFDLAPRSYEHRASTIKDAECAKQANLNPG